MDLGLLGNEAFANAINSPCLVGDSLDRSGVFAIGSILVRLVVLVPVVQVVHLLVAHRLRCVRISQVIP